MKRTNQRELKLNGIPLRVGYVATVKDGEREIEIVHVDIDMKEFYATGLIDDLTQRVDTLSIADDLYAMTECDK